MEIIIIEFRSGNLKIVEIGKIEKMEDRSRLTLKQGGGGVMHMRQQILATLN